MTRAMRMARVRTAIVVGAVRSGIASEQNDFSYAEAKLAAHLHRQVGEYLSAAQYEEIAERCVAGKEVEGGEGAREYSP